MCAKCTKHHVGIVGMMMWCGHEIIIPSQWVDFQILNLMSFQPGRVANTGMGTLAHPVATPPVARPVATPSVARPVAISTPSRPVAISSAAPSLSAIPIPFPPPPPPPPTPCVSIQIQGMIGQTPWVCRGRAPEPLSVEVRPAHNPYAGPAYLSFLFNWPASASYPSVRVKNDSRFSFRVYFAWNTTATVLPPYGAVNVLFNDVLTHPYDGFIISSPDDLVFVAPVWFATMSRGSQAPFTSTLEVKVRRARAPYPDPDHPPYIPPYDPPYNPYDPPYDPPYNPYNPYGPYNPPYNPPVGPFYRPFGTSGPAPPASLAVPPQ